MSQLAFAFDQRWSEGRDVRRSADDGSRFIPTEYGVVPFKREREAKRFVLRHHYAASYPAAHVAIGLWRKTGVAPAALVGVAVFSEGIQSKRGMPHWTGYPREQGTELGRLVLRDEVPFNGESWFIARAFAALRQEKPLMRVVLSYSDPTERRTLEGGLVKPGHFGTIYQASNALFLGRASARTLLLLPDGRVLQPYTFDKFLRRRRGWAGAERTISAAGLACGVAPRAAGEDDAAWVARVRAALRPLRHPGCLTYAFGLDSASWASLKARHRGGLPYPKAGRMAA